MKKLLAAIIAALGLLTGAVAVTQPAAARPVTITQATDAPGQCYAGADFPTEVNGCKFWTDSVCVDGSGINGAYYRVAYIAQYYNNNAYTALDYSDDCVADGYPPSRRMVVGGSHGGASGPCMTWTNNQGAVYHGMARWTNGPGAYINLDNPACVGNQTRRDHAVSLAIGAKLGLSVLYTSGWSGRVMYGNSYSNTALPLPSETGLIYQIYVGSYCTPAFSGC